MFCRCLKDKDNIVRYCSPARYDKNLNKAIPDAFQLKHDEEYLSCFWKEFYKKNDLKNIYKEAKDKLVVKETGGFAILKIQNIKKIGLNNGINNIRAKHLRMFKSYSGIYNTTNDFRFIRDLALAANMEALDKI